jgi:hypothetical protein
MLDSGVHLQPTQIKAAASEASTVTHHATKFRPAIAARANRPQRSTSGTASPIRRVAAPISTAEAIAARTPLKTAPLNLDFGNEVPEDRRVTQLIESVGLLEDTDDGEL